MATADAQLAALQAALAARDAEVAALREIAEAASELQSSDAQAAKVIDLSKKNRALYLQLEREKTKVAKLQQALSAAAAAAAHTDAAAAGAKSGGDEAAAAASRELAVARERLQQMTTRLGAMEQKAFLLEAENKRLARALVREVGDDVPLARVLDEGSDWRGRREQIVHLRDTVRALREAAATAGGGSGPNAAGALARHDAAHRSAIGRANKQRAHEAERMACELEASKKAVEGLRLQYAGASSRRKVLEAEVAGLRDKLAVVLGKTQTDDKLIAALRAELARSTPGVSPDPGRAAAPEARGGERQELRARVEQLQEQVEQQQHVIHCLQQAAAPATSAARSPSDARLEALEDENAELRRLCAGGAVTALRHQVSALQVENAMLQAEIDEDAAAAQRLRLSPSQRQVLQDARVAAVHCDGTTTGSDGDDGLAVV